MAILEPTISDTMLWTSGSIWRAVVRSRAISFLRGFPAGLVARLGVLLMVTPGVVGSSGTPCISILEAPVQSECHTDAKFGDRVRPRPLPGHSNYSIPRTPYWMQYFVWP